MRAHEWLPHGYVNVSRMLLAERQYPRVLLCLSVRFKFQPLWEEICSDFVSELIREVSHFLPGTCFRFSGCSIQGDLPVSAGRVQSVVTNEAEKERSRDFDCADALKLWCLRSMRVMVKYPRLDNSDPWLCSGLSLLELSIFLLSYQSPTS